MRQRDQCNSADADADAVRCGCECGCGCGQRCTAPPSLACRAATDPLLRLRSRVLEIIVVCVLRPVVQDPLPSVLLERCSDERVLAHSGGRQRCSADADADAARFGVRRVCGGGGGGGEQSQWCGVSGMRRAAVSLVGRTVSYQKPTSAAQPDRTDAVGGCADDETRATASECHPCALLLQLVRRRTGRVSVQRTRPLARAAAGQTQRHDPKQNRAVATPHTMPIVLQQPI